MEGARHERGGQWRREDGGEMSDERPTRVRRIIIGLHPSPHGRAALEAAARLASLLGVELRGVYVQEERLMRLPGLSFLQEVDAVSGRVRRLKEVDLERQIRAEAARARRQLARVAGEHDLEWTFRVSRGEVSAVVVEAAASNDLITVGVGTRIGARTLGSTVRALVTGSGRPVMVIRRGMRLGSHVHVVDDGSEAGSRAVGVGRSLTEGREGAPLTIHVGAEREAVERAEEYRTALQEEGRTDAVVRAAPGRGAAAPLAEAGCGLLVLPKTALGAGNEALERLLRHAACPVLVVT